MSAEQKEAVKHQPEDVEQVMEIVHTHGKAILMALALSCVSVLAGVYYVNHKREVRAQASMRFISASSVEDLRAIISDYSSTKTAPLALFRMAGMQFAQMNYNGARASYDEFLQKYPEHDLADAAVMGQYQCLEAQGRTSEALNGFISFEKEHPDHFLTQEAVLAKARCMEQMGRLEEAKAVYEQFATDYPESPNILRANQRLDVIKHAIETGGTVTTAETAPVTGFSLDSFPVADPGTDKAAGQP